MELPFQVLNNPLHRGVFTHFDPAGLFISRSAHVGHDDWSASPFHNVIKCAQGGVDAVRVTNLSLLYHVVVHSKEDDLIFEVGILDERQTRVDVEMIHVVVPPFLISCPFPVNGPYAL